MGLGGATSEKQASRAEAAEWLALLHSDHRTEADEAAFRSWLAERAENRSAFDTVTLAWEVAGGLGADHPIEDVLHPRRARLRRVLPMIFIAVVLLGAGALAWLAPRPGELYATGPRETRRIPARDGSVILLDAGSRLRVKVAADRRDVVLEHGRAHFDVPRDMTRPYRISAGDQTVFLVGGQIDVTRSQDEVSMLALTSNVVVRTERPKSIDWGLEQGTRITFDAQGRLRRDAPDLEKLTAWESGRAVFRDDTLAAAAQELNRYSRRPLVIADPEAARLRVTGVYKAGATEDFSMAMQDRLPVTMRVEPDRIIIGMRQPS